MSFVAACFVPTLQQTIYRTGVYRKALCQFFYANAFVVCFQNQFSSFIVQHSSHLLCLCYTSFCSEVKVLCCIIENCYNVMVLSISLISFSVFLTSSDLQPVAPTQTATLNAICFFFDRIKIFQASIPQAERISYTVLFHALPVTLLSEDYRGQ